MPDKIPLRDAVGVAVVAVVGVVVGGVVALEWVVM